MPCVRPGKCLMKRDFASSLRWCGRYVLSKAGKFANGSRRYTTYCLLTREELDPVVNRISTLQYRFVKGGGFGEAMTVRAADMERFIRAVNSSEDIVYYRPSEVTASMIGKKVRIVGGPLDGMSGNLLSVKGMRKRRLIVELPDMITSAVEISPEYIEFL